MPDFELPQEVLEWQNIDTTRLNNLLLASTLMQTMRARKEETQQEDNAFKALQAVASTTSENYKDDEAYQRYREMHDDVSDREKEFFKTLIHFQTQSLQIFQWKQSYIQHLEGQVKSQEEVKRALEEARKKEASLQQQEREAEQRIQQVIEQQKKSKQGTKSYNRSKSIMPSSS